MSKDLIKQQIEPLVRQEGGSLIGYAHLVSIMSLRGASARTQQSGASPKGTKQSNVLTGLDYAISVGVALNRDILATNLDSPSILYKHHYRYVNMLLDRIAYKIAEVVISHGKRAVPIPASVIIDWEKQLGHISHKEVAYLAGLGWRGKNNLLVNKIYGSSIRLVTILTDLVLTPSTPVKQDCGSCTKCQTHCPVGAIKDIPEKFDRDACNKKVKEFSRKIGVGICGLCLGHCP